MLNIVNGTLECFIQKAKFVSSLSLISLKIFPQNSIVLILRQDMLVFGTGIRISSKIVLTSAHLMRNQNCENFVIINFGLG